MFQFFRKSGQKDRPRSLQTSPSKSTSSGRSLGDVFNGSSSMHTPSGTLCSLEEEEEDETYNDRENKACFFNSRLSKTLSEILVDKGALGYFIQFMDTRNSIALIKFWLEVECLCGSLSATGSKKQSIKRVNFGEEVSHKSNHFISSVDDNENVNSDVLQNNVQIHDISKLSFYDNVNSKAEKSNCKEMPKTSQMEAGNRQSNRMRGGGINNDMTIALQDALKIHKKYIIQDSLGTHRIPEELTTELELVLKSEDIEPIMRCLYAIQEIIYKVLENEYINDFLRSEFHCKHQIDVLTSGNVILADILYNETAFFYFMEFMELENKRELLDFWMSATHYKQNLLEKRDSADPEEAQTDALIIYDKYFSLQATMPLGFSDKIRFQVEQNICREDGGGPQPDCFDKPIRIVYYFLNKHYLPTFLSSQLYYKYLSELITTIQSSPCPSLHSRIQRAGSDCSSEVSSVSMQSTLQAGNNGNKSSKATVSNGMNIDTRQLYDPDSLWRRNKHSLSVGYIDDMGRFVTEIEPDPHRKYESRLTRAVKRLVNMEHDKAKEELAWKIAEMIVREITSLTLGASNLPS